MFLVIRTAGGHRQYQKTLRKPLKIIVSGDPDCRSLFLVIRTAKP
jgi:hypothetical protein